MEQTEWLVVRRNSWCTVDNILIRAGQKAWVHSSDGPSSSSRCAKSLESYFFSIMKKTVLRYLFFACSVLWPVLRLRSHSRWTEIWLNVQFKPSATSSNTFWVAMQHFWSCTLWHFPICHILHSLVSGEQQSNKRRKYCTHEKSKSCHHYVIVVGYLLLTWWDFYFLFVFLCVFVWHCSLC